MLAQSNRVFVSTAHRYWNPQWSAECNRDVYAEQSSAEGLGSNFEITVHAQSYDLHLLDLAVPLAKLKEICDHRCLFLELEEFRQKPSTLENIALFLATKVSPPVRAVTVRESRALACRAYVDQPSTVQMLLHVLNLELVVEREVERESGMALQRHEAWQAVRRIAPQFAEPQADSQLWAEHLFKSLKNEMKGLSELTIDLGGQQFLRVR